MPGVGAHAFNPSTWEAEAVDFWVQGQPGLQSEFQDSQGYTEKPCLEKTKTKTKTKTKPKIIVPQWNHCGTLVSFSGWWDGLPGKSTDYSSKGPEFKSQQPHGSLTIHNGI